jgi:hypothetical protein
MEGNIEKDLGYVILSNLIAQGRSKVGFLYRENPDNKLDSGWRMFSGDEDEDYIENPDNFGMYDSKKVLDIDPSIESLLDSPYKTAFERSGPDQPFVQVHDFEFADDFDEEE